MFGEGVLEVRFGGRMRGKSWGGGLLDGAGVVESVRGEV